MMKRLQAHKYGSLLIIISVAAPWPAASLASIRSGTEQNRLQRGYGTRFNPVEIAKVFCWEPRAFLVFYDGYVEISRR